MPIMIPTIYVVIALLATATCVIVGYGINNGMAAASLITQATSSDSDSTVIQRSSGQSQSALPVAQL